MAAQTYSPGRSYTPKILIVDDEPRMCDSLKALLSGQDYEIHTCNSGKEAAEYLGKDFDLVLLDIVMPDMDGHDVMDYIARQSPETLVVAMTGHASIESAVQALRRRAYDYLRKPFEHEELLKTVENALDQKRLRSERKQAEESLREMEKALRESAKRLRFLSSHLLTAQERERRRISIELHDELGQALAVLKLQLIFIQGELRKDQIVLRADCEDSLCYVDEIIENVRRLSKDLRPSVLEDLGLSAALRRLIDEVSQHNDMDTSVEMDDINGLFSDEAQIIIYRVFQEALANIVKHADTSRVSVSVNRKDGNVSFVVEDAGNGFDVDYVQAQASTEKGLGLVAMDERVQMLGGSLNIWSQEGKGTRITFNVPVDEGGNS
jgi:signal transduction histidine kinase